jgi:hypothetical protein
MLQLAEMMQNGLDIDVDKMEKLQDMGERYEKNEARKAFAADCAIVQENIYAVVKTKVNPQTHSKYAGLDGVLEMARPIYTKYGFSVIFYEGKADAAEETRICADVLHKSGHQRTYHCDIPLDDKGIKGSVNKTKIHGKGSTFSYGRRYLMCLIWNIPTADDDGNAGGNKPAPKINPPTESNLKVVDAIIAIMPPANQDMIIDRNKVARFFKMNTAHYPSDMDKVHEACEYIVQKNPQGIYSPDESQEQQNAEEFADEYKFEPETD